jgi:Protein of unknown function (DUF1569)
MKKLFDKEAYEEIAGRINRLSPETQRHWGKMSVDQMLAHCTITLQTAKGEKYYPQLLIGRLIGRFLRGSIMKEDPFSKNSPTNPAFKVSDSRDFEAEKSKLLLNLKEFHEGGESKCTVKPHSFFGKLTPVEWGTLMYKHLDHHLRQFGV